MTTTPTDPSRLLLTGENPYIQLTETEGAPMSTVASFWRILFSPGGRGHVLFLKSELTGNQTKIYSDNIAVTRYLQQEIEGFFETSFKDQGIPVIEATFENSGDMRSFWQETIRSRDDEVSMTWHNMGEPRLSHSFPGENPRGVCNVSIPVHSARLMFNGGVAKGRPFPRQLHERAHSTCAIAISETWTERR